MVEPHTPSVFRKPDGAIYQRLRANMANDHVFLLAAALGFYALIALIPLALLVGFVLGAMAESSPEAERLARGVLSRFWPAPAATRIEIIESLQQDRGWIGVVGVIGLVWTSTRFVTALRQVLDIVFDIPSGDRLDWLPGKLHDVMMMVLGGVLLIATTAITTVMNRATFFGLPAATPLLDAFGGVLVVASYALGFVTTVVMFFVLYRYVPSRKIPSFDAWLAAFFAGLLFEVAKILFVLNVLSAPTTTLYGSFASIVAVALIVYLSGLTIVFGAELANARRRPEPILFENQGGSNATG